MIGRRRGRLLATAAALITSSAALLAAVPAASAAGSETTASILNYSECANGTSHATACNSWIGNITNGTDSSYREGEVIPQRVLFQVGASTSTQTHVFTVHYDTLKSGVHAFDSLATWNVTQSTADRCQGLSSCPAGSPSLYPIPDDNATDAPLGTGSNGSTVVKDHMLPSGPKRQFALYGGTIVKIGVPNHYPDSSGNEFAEQTMSFTVPASSGPQTLEFLYGGHVASSLDWGQGEGASSITSATYQNALVDLDGNAISTFINRVKNACQPAAPAGFALAKTADKASVSAGDQIGYTITATSNGSSIAKAVSTDDLLPTGAGLAWSEAPDSSACSISGGHLRCSFGDLAPGASASVHIVSGTTQDSPGSISNTVTGTSTNASGQSATAVISVLKPSLTLTKVADKSSVNAGQQIGFSIKLSNAGPGAAYGVALTDALPSGTGLSWTVASGSGCTLSSTLSCTYATLAPGASQTVHVTSTTSSGTASPITNYAYSSASNAPSLSAHDSVTLVAASPTLTLTKTADAASVDAGTSIGFSIALTNSGPGTAVKAVIDDPLPSATGVSWSVASGTGCSITGTAPQKLHCDLGDLGTTSSTVHVVSATTTATSGTLSNTATAKADNAGQVTANATITVKQPQVSFTKTADKATVTAGDTAGWTVSVINNGSGTATGLAISDPLPAGVTWAIDQPSSCTLNAAQQVSCPVGSLASGKSFSVHVTGTTSSSSGTSLYNKATLTGSNTVSVWADSTITVLQPAIVTTKTADASTVSSGDTVGFTVTAKNTGNGTAAGVSVADPLPGGLAWVVDTPSSPCTITSAVMTCAVGSLTAGQSFSVHVSAPTTASTSGQLDNTATTTSTNTPTSKGSAAITVLSPSLTLVKTADAANVDAGGQIGYRISLTSNGPGTARNVTLTDLLPTRPGIVWSLETAVAGCSMPTSLTVSCSRASLAPSEVLSVHITSGTGPTSCGDLGNTATVDGSNVATELVAKATITVQCRPVLELVKQPTCPGQNKVPPGGLMSYTLSFRNTGLATASNAVLTDTPDASTQITAAPGGTVTHSPEKVTWSLGALAPGQTYQTRTVVVKVGLSNGSITNTAALSDPTAVTVTSSLATTVTDAGAATKGSAYAVDTTGLPKVLTIDPNIHTLGHVASQAPGSPNDAGTTGVTLPANPVADVKLLTQTSRSSLDGGTARTSSSSTTGAVNLLGGLVKADAVKAVSTSSATALTAGSDANGSTITNLVVNGTPVATVPGTTVNVKDLSGTITIAKLEILKTMAPNAGLAGGLWSTSGEVTGLTLTLLKSVSPVLPSGVVVKIADAASQATYPSGLVCGSTPASVSGEAYTLYASGNLATVDVGTAKQGDVVLPATGGSADSTVAGTVVGTTLITGTGTTSTSGDTALNPHATSNAHVENLSLLGGAVTASVLDVTSTSSANGTTAGTAFKVVFTNLVIGGQTISLPVTPGTVIAVPQADGSVLYVVLDERVQSSTGGTDTEGTVNAIHAYVLKGSVLQAEVIVASAHSDAHTDHLS